VNIGIETEKVEFKKSTAELEKGIEVISAMLNKHGKGELFFGVNDSGEVVGQQISDNTLREIAQKIKEQIEPQIAPEIEKLTSDDGVGYIRIAFEGRELAYKAKGKYYIRIGTTSHEMTTAQLVERLQAPNLTSSNIHNPYLNKAMLEVEKRLNSTGNCALFHLYQDDEEVIYGVQQAIAEGYLQGGVQTNDGLLIHKITVPGKEYLRILNDSIIKS